MTIMTLWLICDKNTKENGFLGGEGRGGAGEGGGIYVWQKCKRKRISEIELLVFNPKVFR